MKKATLERQLRRLQRKHRALETRFAEQVQFKVSLATENVRLRQLLQEFKDVETDRAQRKIREMDQHEFFLRGMRRLEMSPEARRDSIRKEFAQEMGGTW